MAARKSKPKGRIPGSKNVERSRLVAAAPGEVTALHCELAHRLPLHCDAGRVQSILAANSTLRLVRFVVEPPPRAPAP